MLVLSVYAHFYAASGEVRGCLSCHVGTSVLEDGCSGSSSGTFEGVTLSSRSHHAHLNTVTALPHPRTPPPPTSELHAAFIIASSHQSAGEVEEERQNIVIQAARSGVRHTRETLVVLRGVVGYSDRQ